MDDDRDREWARAVLEATGGRGVDVILDLVGGPYVTGNLKALAERGRWIVVGVTGGPAAPFDLRALMSRRASVTGTVLRARPAEEKMALARRFEAFVVPLFERFQLRPVVDATFPAEQAAEAHRRLEANRSFGKLVLLWA
jgi:NADPH:quinone reductase-like Zn-dependent oxidoreductase